MTGFVGVLGHEFVGVVEALGRSSPLEELGSALLGRRVVGTISIACGHCDICQRGIRAHCRNRKTLGIHGRDGCFADRFVLPLENLLPISDTVEDDRAVFTEPLAAAFRIPEQIELANQSVTVLGDGRLGLLCAQVLQRCKASVLCVGRTPHKWTPCRQWGIRHAVVGDLCLSQDQDVVVDCTGSRDGFFLALQMVRPQGTIVLKTTIAPSARQRTDELYRVVVDEIKVVGSRCGPFPRAISALSDDEIDVRILITHRMSLADGVEGMQTAAGTSALKGTLDTLSAWKFTLAAVLRRSSLDWRGCDSASRQANRPGGNRGGYRNVPLYNSASASRNLASNGVSSGESVRG